MPMPTGSDRCSGQLPGGNRCTKRCGPSGFCTACYEVYAEFTAFFLNKCEDCPLSQPKNPGEEPQCVYANKAVNGFCYFEFWDHKAKPETKAMIEAALQQNLVREYRMLGRMDREMMGTDELDTKLLKQHSHLADQLNRHLYAFARWKGWTNTASGEQEEDKRKVLATILTKEKERVSSIEVTT